MALKLALFDLDGTLLNTLDDLTDATNTALASFGLPALPAEAYKLLVGNGVRALLQRAVAGARSIGTGRAMDAGRAIDAVHDDVRPFDDTALVEAFNREYDSRWANRTRPYDGIPELLDRLHAAGFNLGILSNKPDAFTCLIAERFFPDKPFDVVTGMKPAFPAKPDPALAIDLCRLAGVAPAETALIGDSSTDMLTAVAAGMEPIGVLWGFRSAEELAGSGARHLVQTPDELGQLLLSLR